MIKKSESTPSERQAAATFLRKVNSAIKAAKIKGVKCGVKQKQGKIELSLFGTEDDVFLAFEAIHKRTSSS